MWPPETQGPLCSGAVKLVPTYCKAAILATLISPLTSRLPQLSFYFFHVVFTSTYLDPCLPARFLPLDPFRPRGLQFQLPALQPRR